MTHHDNHNEPVREREVIVTDGGRRGGGAGAALAAVVGVLVVLLLAFLLFGGFGGGDGEADIDAPAIDAPEEININDGGDGAEG